MKSYLPLALATAAVVATQIACTYYIVRERSPNPGVQCLDPSHPALQRLWPDRPGYCVAIAPVELDRDGEFVR